MIIGAGNRVLRSGREIGPGPSCSFAPKARRRQSRKRLLFLFFTFEWYEWHFSFFDFVFTAQKLFSSGSDTDTLSPNESSGKKRTRRKPFEPDN